ncbi:MAG TPA: DNA cytosine methyltransferase [Rhodospirillales bacterium]|nr:DNA cytosine methyltransferase [Rhodospirillales bacterium]
MLDFPKEHFKASVIDLFCGAGGLSHGFYKEGFPIAAGIDIDEACRYPFEKNNDAPFICKDVSELDVNLLDTSFSIFLDDERVDHTALADLAERTEFLWTINNYTDPYVDDLKKRFTPKENEQKNFPLEENIGGFIASVQKPRNLSIMTMDERVGIDFFVNGRIRERDILKHIPTSRLVENYLYGQIHFDDLDDAEDRFTSSREGIVADDPKFKGFLEKLKKEIVSKIIEDWDVWRRKHREDGDPENEAITPRERKSRELFNAVTADYELPEESAHAEKVIGWVDALEDDAQFNFGSYAECFISENLIRNFIEEKEIPLSKEAQSDVDKWKKREEESKDKGNISIDVRRNNNDLNYLAMGELANFVDKKDKSKDASLSRDAAEYKPMRDAVAHTSLLTNAAKAKLTSVYENIKGRIRTLLAEEE